VAETQIHWKINGSHVDVVAAGNMFPYNTPPAREADRATN